MTNDYDDCSLFSDDSGQQRLRAKENDSKSKAEEQSDAECETESEESDDGDVASPTNSQPEEPEEEDKEEEEEEDEGGVEPQEEDQEEEVEESEGEEEDGEAEPVKVTKNQPAPVKGPYLFRRNKEGFLEIGFSTLGVGEGKFTDEMLEILKSKFYFHGKDVPFDKDRAIEFCYALRKEVKRLAHNMMTKHIINSAQRHRFTFPGNRPVRTFSELKACWRARQRQRGTLRALHRIMYSDWDKRSGWQDHMERAIMASRKLIYTAIPEPKKKGRPNSGCIHKMVGHQLNELRRQVVRTTGYSFTKGEEPDYDEDKWHFLNRHPDVSEDEFTVSTTITIATVQQTHIHPPDNARYLKQIVQEDDLEETSDEVRDPNKQHLLQKTCT